MEKILFPGLMMIRHPYGQFRLRQKELYWVLEKAVGQLKRAGPETG